MMLASVCLTACGSDNDEDDGGGNSSSDTATFTIDGEAYYPNSLSTIEQSSDNEYDWDDSEVSSNGLYFHIQGGKSSGEFGLYDNGKILEIYTSHFSKVKNMTVGETLDVNDFSIRDYRGYNEITVNTYSWDELEGTIEILEVSNYKVKIKIDNLKIESRRGAIHTFNGTVVFKNSLHDSDGNVLPFY